MDSENDLEENLQDPDGYPREDDGNDNQARFGLKSTSWIAQEGIRLAQRSSISLNSKTYPLGWHTSEETNEADYNRFYHFGNRADWWWVHATADPIGDRAPASSRFIFFMVYLLGSREPDSTEFYVYVDGIFSEGTALP
ncbi:hypothetical protein NLI96_g4569 [Meripilus lineatus]|uniref:Uncharacterized protein n=1 Tax=Meripilus lineatus TaxID=2056292 RepID=A0AAD5YJT5_9APHY|nr:hypothetical protein NLI96_g4569 [Physisporinus lineatus]